MGITYKAFDTNLRTHVALKVINGAYLNSDVARQRFLREARAAAAIRHPNVATVFHLGEEEENYFYAMEFVDGETVESWMKKHGSVPTLMALHIASQVARALTSAQKQNLVHRDIKPANLMLVPEDGEYTVKVIDFGLAKQSAKDEGTEDLATLTMAGFLGTPHFASPEQLEERRVDVRSDIYSLGVTLWYMLAGKTPFTGSLVQVMSQHINREPPFENLEGQPAEVVRLLKDMMAKDPGDRPQTPSELRREIEACMESIEDSQEEAKQSAPAVAEGDFETVVEDEEPSPDSTVVAVGATLAGRFKLLEDHGLTENGHLYKASSAEDPNLLVALYVLEPGQLGSREALTRLEEDVFRLQKVDSPHVRRVLSIERTESVTFLSLEWLVGRSLLDLMKERQSLPMSEAMPILSQIADGLDALERAGADCPDLSLYDIRMLDNPGTNMGMLVRFDALRLEHHANASPEATVVSSPASVVLDSDAFGGNKGGPYALMLTSVAYELLGGLRSGAEMGTFVPLSAVPRQTNDILKKGLDPNQTYASATEVAQALAETEQFQASAAPTPEQPAPSAPPSTPATPQPVDPAAESDVPANAPPPFPTQFREQQKKKSAAPLVIGIAAGVLLLAGAGGGTWFYLSRPATPPIAQTTPSPTPEPTESPEEASPTPDPETEALNRILAVAREAQEADNYEEALKLYSRAAREFPDAEQPRVELEKISAKLYSNAVDLTPSLFAELRPALEEAATEDTRSAQMILAEELRQADPSDSLKWYIAAAKQGHAQAMTAAGHMMASGAGLPAVDMGAAAEWFEKAAESGEPGGAYALGEMYHYGNGIQKDRRKAFEYLSRAATFEEPRAMTLLAGYYRSGDVVPQDYKESRRLYQRAIDLGNVDALTNLGVMEYNGEGTSDDEPDFTNAANLWQKAVDAGHVAAKYFLAGSLLDGRGVPQDTDKALQLFRETVSEGFPPGQFTYANLLWDGDAVKRDREEAKRLYREAARAGIPPAQQKCEELGIEY